MKKLFVNEDACIGCGSCVAIDSKHFNFNEDGLSEVINNEDVETDEAKNAISSCPTNAISYIDDEDKKCHCKSCTCEDDKCTCHGEDDECECEDCHCND